MLALLARICTAIYAALASILAKCAPWLKLGFLAAILASAVIYVRSRDAAQQAIGEARCQAQVRQAMDQAQADLKAIQASYAAQISQANQEYQRELAAISTRIVSRPVWLRAPADLCPAAVSPAGQAGSGDPGAGGVQPGLGVDIRPRIEALKAKYETALAGCRLLDRSWPK